MAAGTFKLGWESVVTLDTANVGDFLANADLTGRTTGNLAFRRANPSSDHNGLSGYEGKEYGIKGCSLTLDILDDQPNDAPQDHLMDDFFDGVKRWVRVRPRVGTGHFEFSFLLVLSACTATMENGGIVRWNIAGDSHGTITHAAQ